MQTSRNKSNSQLGKWQRLWLLWPDQDQPGQATHCQTARWKKETGVHQRLRVQNAIEATLPAQSGPSPSQSSSSASRPSAPAPVQVLQPGQELGGASSSRATPPARDKAAANSEPKRIDCQQVLPERRAPGEASSIYSLSTIWFGSVPIIKRLDKGSEAWLDRLDPILFVHVYLLQFKTALLSLSCHGPGATASQHWPTQYIWEVEGAIQQSMFGQSCACLSHRAERLDWTCRYLQS